MASDGNIDKREIATPQSLCQKLDLFKDFDFQDEINKLVNRINIDGKQFIKNYFDLLNNANLKLQLKMRDSLRPPNPYLPTFYFLIIRLLDNTGGDATLHRDIGFFVLNLDDTDLFF